MNSVISNLDEAHSIGAIKRTFEQIDVGSIDAIQQIRSRIEKVAAVGVFKCMERLQPAPSPIKQAAKLACAYLYNPATGIKRRKIEMPQPVKSILTKNGGNSGVKKTVAFKDSPTIKLYVRDETKPMRPFILKKKKNRSQQMPMQTNGFTFSSPIMIDSARDQWVDKMDAIMRALPNDNSEADTEDEDEDDDELDSGNARTSQMMKFVDEEKAEQTSKLIALPSGGQRGNGRWSLQRTSKKSSMQAVPVYKTKNMWTKFSYTVNYNQKEIRFFSAFWSRLSNAEAFWNVFLIEGLG